MDIRDLEVGFIYSERSGYNVRIENTHNNYGSVLVRTVEHGLYELVSPNNIKDTCSL
jgi:hypothetical protein